jgi:hypothetical protein
MLHCPIEGSCSGTLHTLEKKKSPMSRRGDRGILHLLTLLLKNERELAFMYLLSLNMNTEYTLMLWLVLRWVSSQITKMHQSHIQKKSVFWSREGALTNAKPTLHQELRPKLNSNQAILLVLAAPEISPNGFTVCNSQDQTEIIIIF